MRRDFFGDNEVLREPLKVYKRFFFCFFFGFFFNFYFIYPHMLAGEDFMMPPCLFSSSHLKKLVLIYGYK